MNREMQIIREVNIQAEIFYPDSVRLGDHAASVIGRSRRSQMTGLENIADSALKTSDIFDYIKRQTARFSFWRQSFPNENQFATERHATDNIAFGERLIHHLQIDLAERRDTICGSERLNIDASTYENQHLRRQVHLLLIRQFIHQMVAQYEFRASLTTIARRERH
ncbi:hypothetical protein KSF_053550 [Reticulibacter mediterranei]|uniref:Uncharacterized protein n=1 Tax=Reticulibacter mediterranei TaxID=2778369 RepID=A0A8J3IQY6_9CHLR|nr:hypothetical protein [Reticulibacter mediterranei]GHO95307.1 hypothetical protein KSF_053550 [Reticulibacter mediterranei]